MRAARPEQLSRFLAGHAVSALGSKMQAAALLWHVYALTNSALALGALGFIELVPLVLLAPVGGVAADRFDRRVVLGVAQAVQLVPALALALLTFGGLDSVWLVFGVAAVGAAAQSVDTAARKSLVPGLVERDGLARAMSAVDLTKNVAKLAGPALMGVVVASAGLGWVYLFNALSFAAMIVALFTLRETRVSATPRSTSFAGGLQFVRRTPVVRSLILLDFVATLFAGAESLLPMVADRILGVGVLGYGMLSSSAAVGALAGGALLVLRPPQRRLGRIALGAVAIYGVSTIAFGVATSAVLVCAALVVLGAADTVSTVLRNTLVQLETPDDLRGRVTAVSQIFSKSGPKLGQLEAGLVASWFGVGLSIVSGGVLCLVALGWIAWRHQALRDR